MGIEDGPIEWLTLLCFLSASVLFFLSFNRSKNIFLLALCLLFLFGAGEEISWGQRIFNYDTPAMIVKKNIQKEFNVHNLVLFNQVTEKGEKKTGWHWLFQMEVLYRTFSLIFCILIPLCFYCLKPFLPKVNLKIRMPVVPFTIGIFVFISWAIFTVLKAYPVPVRPAHLKQYFTNGEIFEFTTSCIYFTIALYFFNTKKDSFLGKGFNETLKSG